MGLFDVFRKGLNKTRTFISEGLTKIAAGAGKFNDDMLDDFEELLVRADCGVEASVDIIDAVKSDIKKSGNASKEAVIATVERRMLEILGPSKELEIEDGKLNIILLVGVNGTGKTTTAGKLSSKYKALGKKVVLAAADTFRAAAIEQLKEWGERTSTTVIAHDQGGDPAAVCFDAIKAAYARKADVLIIDTAGRLQNKKNLMDELAKVTRLIAREAPDANCKSLLIIDATTGQNGVIQAETFGSTVALDYIGITKLDGSAKGGVAIAISYATKVPIVLAGLGERTEDLIPFNPNDFVKSLVEE
ncbi:MAG: signal recognition particle-docking protein FtsY [Saccharofermentanaceae bacterium]|nr:signal recognition particle-docking protein FtsY [Clostridia bacterium]NLX67935.1 signal recognition particle-docking protein FtsY [Clostridiaceae bacterium]HOO48443.1 signal recognition particle-docking protein FtsY [Saccharofermentans sp.]HPE27422.1 signal recognition particle-docking protein FtsY [Saccharofermentans sp.]HPG64119.1 signal recognition particle-docking protein FtsY [Saccharofermentans sp.]